MSYPIHYVPAGDVLPIFFATFDGGTGASITLTGLAVTDIEIYKDGGVTQRASDAGYTLLDTDGIDFDAITGIHGFSIDTGDNTDAGFYTVGAWFHVVVSSVTVDAQTVNFIAAAFRIMAAETVAAVPKADVSTWDGTDVTTGVPLAPTVAGRTLDVSAGGEAGLDWANVGSPTTAQNLSATNIDVDQVVASVSGAVGSVTGAVGSVTGAVGSVTGAVGSVGAGGIAAASFAAGAIDASAIAADAIGASEIAANAIGASELAADAVAEIADGVWDEAVAGHLTQGTYGERQNAVISGNAIAGTLSTTQMTTDLTEATDSHYNGRTIIWTSGVLLGQATNITAYTGASKMLTYTAITEAPSAGDDFLIV